MKKEYRVTCDGKFNPSDENDANTLYFKLRNVLSEGTVSIEKQDEDGKWIVVSNCPHKKARKDTTQEA
jgi:hypothetical protein